MKRSNTGDISSADLDEPETIVYFTMKHHSLSVGLPTPAPAFNPPDPNHAPRRRERGRRDDGYGDVASDEMSQIFTVLSPLPLTIRLPSGLKLTLQT